MGNQACGRSTTRARSPGVGHSAVLWRDIQFTPACRKVEAGIPCDHLADFWSAAGRLESWPQGRSSLAFSFCLASKPSMDDPPFRGFEITADYRQRCEGELRFWLECQRGRRSRVPPAPRLVDPEAPVWSPDIPVLSSTGIPKRLRNSTCPYAGRAGAPRAVLPPSRIWSLSWDSTSLPLRSVDWASPGSGTIR